MATYYVDANAGSDSNPGTIASPKRTPEFNWLANDVVNLRRGGLYNVTSSFKDLRTGVQLQAYGADGPMPVLRNPSGGGNMILNGATSATKTGIVVDGIDFDCTTDTGTKISNGIYFAAQSTGTLSGNIIRNSRFRGAAGNGCSVGAEDNATGTSSTFTFENCDFEDNGSHGLILIGIGHKALRNRCRRNGLTGTDGGHGISARWLRTTVTSGYSLVSGTIYSFTVAANKTGIDYIRVSAGAASATYPMLAKNTSTPTTPGLGEYGVSGTTVYINVGTNPTGHSFLYAWGKTEGLIIQGNVCTGNRYNPAAPFYEGHGIALDDFTQNSYVLDNDCLDNDGLGVSINMGNGNTVRGNVLLRNCLAGVFVSRGTGAIITGNTIAGNNIGTYGTSYASDVILFDTSINATVRDNVIIARSSVLGTDYAIGTLGTSGPKASMTVQNNHCRGYTTAVEAGIANTGTVTTDPLVSGGYRPKPGSPLLSGGTNTYRRDKEGRQARSFVGAYCAATLRQALSAT